MTNVQNNIGCTVIGDAIVDIMVPVHSFDQLGAACVGGILNTAYAISSGGTANVATGLSTLGVTSAFIGRVGADCFGNLFIEGLEEAHVLAHISVSQTRNTGLSIAISSTYDKDRFFIVDRGANVELSISDLDYGLAHNSNVVYFTGFSLQDSNVSKTVLSFVEEAASAGKTVVFNPGAHSIVATSKSELINAIKKYADVVVLNRTEGQHLSQESEDEQIMEFLLSLGVRTVALTKDEQGSLISTDSTVHRIKAHPCEVLDSTGAGDAYAVGVIYGMVKGWGLDKTGNFATNLAQAVIRQRGPRCDFSKIRALFASQ